MNKKLTSMIALVMGMVTATSLVACGKKPEPDTSVTYNTTTSVMPSNWNEFTYADNNDTQILSYISSSFFEYDYMFDEAKGGKFKADGSINTDAIVEGGFSTKYSAATAIEDVTATVDAKWGYTDKQKTEGGYAWKITLRDDLKWDDGTAIDAGDFVYSMKQILDPAFMNFRANTYYDTLRIKNSKNYFYQNTEGTYEPVGSQGFASNQAAIDAGKTLYVDIHGLWGAAGYVDAEGNECPQWVTIDDATVYDTADAWAAGKEVDPISGADLWAGYSSILEVGGSYADAVAIYVVNEIRDVKWDSVGIYEASTNSIVICLDKSYQFLKEDGSLSYLSAYYMSSLPLVKESLYESCKQAPAVGATLWTSNYNSSLATTASWGPYKLVEFQSGKSYKLVKNDNWYGYALEDNKGQYNIDAIACECVPEESTKWMKFLNGEVDDAVLDTDHVAEYMYSKYTQWSAGSGTFGMQLYGNKAVLANSENNNGILAIDEFRQAFSLALNRNDVVETIWPGSSLACYGILSPQYYYDIEAGLTYRESIQAKEGLLRAYGYTQGEDGTWSNGAEVTGATLEDAYDSLTGYNPTLAKQLMQTAYDKLVANAEDYGYDASKEITIVYGSSSDTPKQRERCTYLQGVLDAVCAGTSLEGKIKLVFDASAGSKWSDAFRNGDTQIGFGYGFSGNPFNPFDIVGAFVDPDDSLNYHAYWNTKTEMMTLTMPEGDYEGAGEEITMSLENWYKCLNGLADENSAKKYNWDAGKVSADVRLVILAALEEQVIKKSYSVMLISDYTGSLLGAQFSQLSTEYNTFMGFGGIRYMKVNYNNHEWSEFVKSNNNDLTAEYKKTN